LDPINLDSLNPNEEPALLTAVQLTCDYAENPIGLESAAPRFAWQLRQSGRGKRQTAYRILVASSQDELRADHGTLWDSGKVVSDQSIGIPYAGQPLASGQVCYWQVCVWDLHDQCAGYSAAASFEMGLLRADDWQGDWIGGAKWRGAGNFHEGPALLFRKEFSVTQAVKKARLYIAGLGYYVASLNGRRVGDHVLDPGFTDYSVRVLYATYDIGEHLVIGQNAIGVMVGNGWYGSIRWRGTPGLKLQLNLEFADGSRASVLSGLDQGWQVAGSPITRNSIYDGETYDARLERPGWDTCRDQTVYTRRQPQWRDAMAVNPPGGRMVSQLMEPIRAIEEIRPISLSVPRLLSKNHGVQPEDYKRRQKNAQKQTDCSQSGNYSQSGGNRSEPSETNETNEANEPNLYVFDLGQNVAGHIRLKVSGPRGTRIVIRHAETLLYNGAVNTANLYLAKACDTYILKGKGVEVYEPAFTYHGFRYVQLEGYPGEPDIGAVTGIVVHSAVQQTGHFECNHPLINQIQRNILWTERDNLHSVPTDCPQRNERFGWLNDTTARNEEAVYNFNLARFLPKWMDDIRDTQTDSGAIADCAPFVWWCSNGGEPVNSTYVITIWLLYQHYGDVGVLRKHYDSIKQWVDFLDRTARDHILYHGWIGDWAPPRAFAYTDSICSAVSRTTSFEYISTGFYYLCAKLLTRMARVLDQSADEQKYRDIAQQTQAAFNKKFLDRRIRQYGQGSQAAHAFALYLGLVPDDVRQDVIDHLAHDVMAVNHGHLTTGNLCTKYLLEALTCEGRHDVAWALATQTTYPSWGYMISQGATTIWERWEYETGREMNSHNHPMYGSIGAWFYRALAGISLAEDAVGFDRILIRPRLAEGLSFVRSSLDTVRGPIVVHWDSQPYAFRLSTDIPPNCSANVMLPLLQEPGARQIVRESGKIIWDGQHFIPGAAEQVGWQPDHDGWSLLIGSGSYCFTVERSE
jgi:alpha-L-rhamnosidase